MNSFIIVKRINDSALDVCTKGIVTQIKSLQTQDMATILAKLDNPESVYTTNISKAIPLNPEATGVTNWATNNSGNILFYNYNIKLRPLFTTQATKLAIASTLLHELVHAYFLSLIDDCYISNNCIQLQTFPDLWNFYVTHKNGGVLTNPETQHNQIAQSYVHILAASLQEYSTGIPLAAGENPQQIYTDLAWGGLKGTIAYENLPLSDRKRIDYRNEAENYNSPSMDESGNIVFIPSGATCN